LEFGGQFLGHLIVRLAAELERPVATPAEACTILGLPG